MRVTAQRIAFAALVMSVALMSFLFAESRSDPSLRIAALVAGTGLVSSLASIASTMLTGKDVTHKDSDLPPGSTVQSSNQTVVQTPPITATSSTDTVGKV